MPTLLAGKLVVHNKTLKGGRGTYSLTQHLKSKRATVYKNRFLDTTEHTRIMQDISEISEVTSPYCHYSGSCVNSHLIWQVTFYIPASRISPKLHPLNTILVHHQPL